MQTRQTKQSKCRKNTETWPVWETRTQTQGTPQSVGKTPIYIKQNSSENFIVFPKMSSDVDVIARFHPTSILIWYDKCPGNLEL